MKAAWQANGVQVYCGDCRSVLASLPDSSVQTCVTSPPYWGLRDYGVDGQLGLEQTPEAYVAGMVEVFREVRRVLRDDGTLWLNLGDSYASSGVGGYQSNADKGMNGGAKTLATFYGRAPTPPGLKPKDLVGIPWRVAFALQADGWYLRSDIIWAKPNPMPESVTDRPTKAHEYLFLLSKSERYYYDAEAVAEVALQPRGKQESAGQQHKQLAMGRKVGSLGSNYGYETRNRRSVWEVATQPYAEAHFATFPPKLIEPCIKAGCPVGGVVLDPFAGAGTTLLVSVQQERQAIGIELNPEYVKLIRKRLKRELAQPKLPFAEYEKPAVQVEIA